MPPVIERQQQAASLLSDNHWQSTILATKYFELFSAYPSDLEQAPSLTVYIEGDGLAWLTRTRISVNPTPINPVGLKLALQEPSKAVAYLARPCQYIETSDQTSCSQVYSTQQRFAPEVIAASSEAIDKLKKRFNTQELVLVGYSGGSAVAALLAAQRNDVTKLITVAANLNHKAWTDFHHISPLIGSLNPIDYHEKLATIEQVHFVGGNDEIIPPFLMESFVAALPSATKTELSVMNNQGHSCCWQVIWKQLKQGL